MYTDRWYIFKVDEAHSPTSGKAWGFWCKPVGDGRAYAPVGPENTALPELWREYPAREDAEAVLLGIAERFNLFAAGERERVAYMHPQEGYARRMRGLTELAFSDGRFTYSLYRRKETPDAPALWHAGFRIRGLSGRLYPLTKEVTKEKRLLEAIEIKDKAEACLRAVAEDYSLVLVDGRDEPCGGPWRASYGLPYRRGTRGILRGSTAGRVIELGADEAVRIAQGLLRERDGGGKA